jgi:hypothetical protein
MRTLTESEYINLKTNFADQLELIKHNIVGRGVQVLIPLYEDLIGSKMNKNCDDCILDMMIILSLNYSNYEKNNSKGNDSRTNIQTEQPMEKNNRKRRKRI